MKLLFFFVFTIFAINSFSQEQVVNPLLYCLGDEEATLHKNKTIGPVYKINKVFIDELSAFDQIFLKNHYLQDICFSNTEYSPSINLLKHLLIHGEELFDIRSHTLDFHRISLKSSIRGLVSKSPSIFITWFSEIQSSAPSHDCLDKYIPEISEIKLNVKYLEEEVGFSKLIDSSKVETIFNKLKTLDTIFEKCRKDHQRRELDIIKGKVI